MNSSDPAAIVEERRRRLGRVVVELGCGETKSDPDSIGIDLRDLPGVDIVDDAYAALAAIPEGSVDLIDSSHFCEHVPDLRALLAASARVLVRGGTFRCTVPHFSNPFYYSDPTHRQPFGLYTFNYLVESSFTRRDVPHYDNPLPFRLVDARYGFKSYRPHYVRHGLKQIGRAFNASRWTKEWFEERWVWTMPAYEVTFTLVRL